jgi:hypothetical protein
MFLPLCDMGVEIHHFCLCVFLNCSLNPQSQHLQQHNPHQRDGAERKAFAGSNKNERKMGKNKFYFPFCHKTERRNFSIPNCSFFLLFMKVSRMGQKEGGKRRRRSISKQRNKQFFIHFILSLSHS